MSLVFNMVGGGGGFNPSNALIHVNAPLGSTVEFELGGVVVAAILPAKAFPNVDGETADYYYPVKSANYGTWTVTASLSGNSVSDTVTVNAAAQYNVELPYNLYLVKAGINLVTFTFNGATASQETGRYIIQTGGSGSAYCPVDITRYSTLKIAIVDNSYSYVRANSAPYFGLCNQTPTGGSAINNMVVKTELTGTSADGNSAHRKITAGTFSADISGYSGNCYACLNIENWAGQNGIARIADFWLEH